MGSDFERILESKQAYRKRLAAKPISEKLRIVEELAERALATRKDTSSPLPEEPWQVPENWRWSRMGDVATIIGGGTPSTDRPEYFGGDVPWITPADLSGYKEKTISRGARNITQDGLENSGARLMPAKTILFSSRAPIGYVAIASNPVATNQGFKSFILRDGLLPDFVYYYLQRAKEFAVALASGTTFLEISGKNAARLPIPIPPLVEQRQIVAEIEKQFTRLDAGIAALRRVQANLKRYRAAVLNAACEGRLVPTEAELARKEGRAYESADKLLARVLTERRKKWSGRGKYNEPVNTSTANLPPIPEGWTWTILDSLFRESLRNGHSAKATRTGNGLRAFTLSAVTQGDFSERNTKLTVADPEKVEDLWAEPGDIYIERSNTPELVGIARLYKGPARFAFIPDLLIRVRVQSLVLSRFVELCLLSERGRTFFRSRAQGISGTMPKIDQAVIERAPIPLPPFAEQLRIVAEVERQLSVVDEQEAVVLANLQRATRLRQSILRKAFAGS